MASRRMKRGEQPLRPTPDRLGRYSIPPEVLRFDTLIDVALIVLGVYILQPFISTSVTDTAGRVSIVAWALAIPLLAFLVLLNRAQEAFRYASIPPYLVVARGLTPGAAVVGFGAAIWHPWMPASLVLIAGGLGGLFLYRAYHARLEHDNAMDKPAD